MTPATIVFANDGYDGSYQAGVSTVFKLENFSAHDLNMSNVRDVYDVYSTGNGSVIYSSSAQPQNSDAPLYRHGMDLVEMDYIDTVMGGLGDDFLVGGKGGDMIGLTGGHDTLVYASPADSNLSGMMSSEQSMTFDRVEADPQANVEKVSFDFGGGVLGAHSVDANAEQFDMSNMIASLDAAYHQVATSRYDAVLVSMGSSSILLVNNGDDQIDGNDYAVAIVGTGSIALDGFGNVVYTLDPAPATESIAG